MKSRRGYYDMLLRSCARHHSRIAVRHLRGGRYSTYTYSELYGVCECVSQHLQLLRCTGGTVGVLAHRNPLVPAIIAAVHKNSPTFMFLDPLKDNRHIMNRIKFQAIIAVHHKDEPFHVTASPDSEICLYDTVIKFYKTSKILEFSTSEVADLEYSFIMATSGSTGEPKHVDVPIQCIQPNIDDLTKMFNVTSTDVVYFSTPLTFDPSMVEMLLACSNGASLLLAPVTDIISQESEHAVTVWQTTPSLFFRLSNSDIARILSTNSKLKILAFGGEPLNHVKRLKELKNEGNVTRVFCLYGVTELSCWACAVELKLDKMEDDQDVPMGTCLSETELRVYCEDKIQNIGNIYLGSSTRKCNILNKSSSPFTKKRVRWHDTGDVGEYRNGTVYYRGRTDDIIKRFGHKVNLQLIEKTVLLCPEISSCSCLWLPKPHILVLYYTSDSLSCDDVGQFLKNRMDDKTWPDKIIRINSMPLSAHGKISKKDLAVQTSIENMHGPSDDVKMVLVGELRRTLGRKFTYNDIRDKDFFSIGGTSFLAVSMCNKLKARYPQHNFAILTSLLSPNVTIDNILKLMQSECTKSKTFLQNVKKRRKTSQSSISVTGSKVKRLSPVPMKGLADANIEEVWSFDTGKCVDATPTIFQSHNNSYLAVGSHSGKVVVLNATDGSLYGQLDLNTRVEAPVLCFQSKHNKEPLGVVGAYDGTVVCFTLTLCLPVWKISVGAMIKSKAAIVNDVLYVASYDGTVRCINPATGDITSKITVSAHGITADLLNVGRAVVACALDGVCVALSTDEGARLWSRTVGGPVFAAPVLCNGTVLVAEVNGVAHCLSAEDGSCVWKYDGTSGNIYSSFSIKNNSSPRTDFDVVFGCHDSNVYCLSVSNNNKVKLKWKTRTIAPIFSTPCYLNDSHVLASTIKGKLHVIETDGGRVIGEYRMPGDTFSSPTVLGDRVFVGCRDDKVYSLKFSVPLIK